jgi:hypothetical protein
MPDTKNPLQSIDLGWRARTRPASGFAHVLAAGAGAFAVFSVTELVTKIASTNQTAPGILLNLALAVAAFVAGMFLPGPVRSAAVVALVLSTPLIWLYAFFGNGQMDAGGLRGVYLLSAAVFLGLYAWQWTRGRAVFLAFSLFFVVSYLEFEVSRQLESGSSATSVPFLGGLLTNPFNGPAQSPGRVSSLLSTSGFRTGNITATVALVLGVLFLVAAGLLIRRGYKGVATPFLVVGAVEGFAAAATLGPNERSVVLGGLLAAAVGTLLALAGTGNSRRGSVWIGVIAVVVSILAVLADATSDDLGRAGYSALVAVGLLFISLVVTHRLHEDQDNEVGAT